MATSRRDERSGWLGLTTRLDSCRCGCGAPIPSGRRTFASDQCVHEWKIRTSPAYCREQVGLRDRGVCALCGIDTLRLQRRVNRILARARGQQHLRIEAAAYRRVWAILLAWRWVSPSDAGQRSWRSPAWAADHIVAVKLGGGACDLSNMQTLCRPCHLAKTRLDREAIKRAKTAAVG